MADEHTTSGTEPAAARLPTRFAAVAAAVESALVADMDRWLGEVPEQLGQAIRYAALGPGKRIRPVLLLWSAQLCGLPAERAMPAAVAVELLHTYSLVHDDLPAMDNDDLRRGRPTCHVVYGQGAAILVGDALLTRAFEVLAHASLPAERIVRLIATLARSSGAAGMIGGQAEDLRHEQAGANHSSTRALADVNYIHEHKTAELICASCTMGAIAAGADEKIERALGNFGRSLGITFQIADDLLDELKLADRLGKHAGKDRAAGKLTYPAAVGLEASRQAAEAALARAEAALADLAAMGCADRYVLADLWSVGRYVIDRTL